jgi:alpha-L-rhamnosidase
VTQLLHPGPNAIGARLGNSKFGYLDIYTNRTALGDQSGDASRAFRLVLVASLSDGSDHILTSAADGSWHMRHGPIVYDHLWHGEIYDSRQELQGWSSKPIGSFPPGSWEPAKAMSPKVGRLYPQLMQPIRKIDAFEARSETKVGSGVVFDMGQNMAGLCTLTFNPASVAAARNEGDSAEPLAIMLRLRHTEITSPNGSTFNNYYPGMEFNHASATCSMQDWYNHKWYECANQTDGYVFSVPRTGENLGTTVEYTPSFTYHGFRHVELVATQLLPGGGEGPLPASVQASFPWGAKLVAHRSHTDMPALTTLSLNGGEKSEMIGRIFNATIAAHVSNVWSIPTGTTAFSWRCHQLC